MEYREHERNPKYLVKILDAKTNVKELVVNRAGTSRLNADLAPSCGEQTERSRVPDQTSLLCFKIKFGIFHESNTAQEMYHL
jgi:hypothetical protein